MFSKVKNIDITRPDKLLLSGLKTLTNLSQALYFDQKSEAKERGELAFIGQKKVEEVQTQLFQYDPNQADSQEQVFDFNFLEASASNRVSWLNFHGLHDVELIQKLGTSLKLDRITVKQTLDTTLRPKVEEYDHYLFFSIKSILKSPEGNLEVEQHSFVLGEYYVISFQEQLGDHFDHIRNKITENLGLVRKKGADFLLYQLLDAILDNYFETIENINQDIKILEKLILQDPTQEALIKLEHFKQVAEQTKKSLTPFKDSLRTIQNRKTGFIREDNQKYFQDLTNNCFSAIEEIDSTAKSLEGLTNIYFSSLSQKMNETMKVLTTVATIFIPLTFIAGIYGMNFENMPELSYRFGYFITWIVMGIVAVGMLIYFKRKDWL